MSGILKKVLPGPLYKLASSLITEYYKRNPDAWRIAQWEKEGKPNPPPHIIKSRTIKKYANDFPVFVETGTYKGDMLKAVEKNFEKLFSIELDDQLHQAAVQRFSQNKNIEILKGDSGQLMPDLLSKIDQPVAFWLDGHYSGGITAKADVVTPIINELQAIEQHMQQKKLKHIILIDDANLFNGTDDYPTVAEMKKAGEELFPDYHFLLEYNIIIYQPK